MSEGVARFDMLLDPSVGARDMVLLYHTHYLLR